MKLSRRDTVIRVLLIIGLGGLCGWFGQRAYRGAERQNRGDFKHFFWAGEAIKAGDNIYQSGELKERKGYIYPPMIAIVVRPLIELGRPGADFVWAGMNITLTILGVLLGHRVIAARLGPGREANIFLAVTLLALALTYEQVRWELEEGQTDTYVLMGFVGALLLLDRAPIVGGFLLGVAANVKYQSLIGIPYLLLRLRWRAAVGVVTGAVGIALSSALVFGWQRNLEYLATALGGLASMLGFEQEKAAGVYDLTWNVSVSIPSAIARQISDSDGNYSTGLLVVLVGAVAGALVAVCWSIYKFRGVPLLAGRGGLGERVGFMPGVVLLEWCGLIVATLLFSPQSTVRHGFILLFVHQVVAYILLVKRPGVNKIPLIVGVAVAQLGSRLPPGEEGFEAALAAWRSVGGFSWCLMVMFVTLLWTGLAYVKATPDIKAEQNA